MRFVICDSQRMQNCIAHIQGLPMDKRFIVEIKPEKRSLNQNDLWHKWIDMMAEHCGMSPEDMKVAVKRKVLGMRESTDPLTGEITYSDWQSSTMDKGQFSTLMTNTQFLALEYYGMTLPSPNDMPDDLWS